MLRIPYVRLVEDGAQVRASAGFALRTIMCERLMADPKRPSFCIDRLRAAHAESSRLFSRAPRRSGQGENLNRTWNVAYPFGKS